MWPPMKSGPLPTPPVVCISARRMAELIEEFNTGTSHEARLARDADQLALILDLKTILDNGHLPAGRWIDNAVKRLHTPLGKEMAAAILDTERDDWWFDKAVAQIKADKNDPKRTEREKMATNGSLDNLWHYLPGSDIGLAACALPVPDHPAGGGCGLVRPEKNDHRRRKTRLRI
jgi:hypothetical protein